jgi:hypothetical protein
VKNSAITFEEIARMIRPDGLVALILLEEQTAKANKERAMSIVKKIISGTLDYEIMREDFPAIMLFRLPAEHAREAILKLTESGFTKLKAIHPFSKRRP